MTTRSILQQISLEARRLAFFAQANSEYSSHRLGEIESQRGIPDGYTFSSQIRAVNQQIQSVFRRRLPNRQFRDDLFRLSSDLHNRISSPSELMHTQIATLDAIHRLVEGNLHLRAATPPVSELAIEEWDQINAEDMRENTERLDDEIIHKERTRLFLIGQLIPQLRENPQWNQALEDKDARLFETFPALVEGSLIQLHGSYEDYSASGFGKGVDKETYEAVHALSFAQLSDMLAADLDGNNISDLIPKLRSHGLKHRSLYERLLYLGLNIQPEVDRQRALSLASLTPDELNTEILAAMNSEGHSFLADVVTRLPLDSLRKDVLADLTVWLATRGATCQLNEIIRKRGKDLLETTLCEALEETYKWDETLTNQILFDAYPHQRSAKTLLLALAQMGDSEKVSHVLSNDYPSRESPHHFPTDTINEVFQIACAHSDLNVLKVMIQSRYAPDISDENLLAAFKAHLLSGSDCLGLFLQTGAMGRIPEAFAAMAAINGQATQAISVLDSVPGRVITTAQFEEMLIALANNSVWSSLIRLMDYPHFQPLNGNILTDLLGKAVVDGPLEAVQKILSKSNRFNPIYPDNKTAMFRTATLNGDVDKMEALFSSFPSPLLSRSDIIELLTHCLNTENRKAVCLLLRVHGSHGEPLLSQAQLKELIFSCARAGDMATFLFISSYFPHQITLETLKEAEAVARLAGQADASGYLWHFLWHSYALQGRLERSGELAAKRTRRNH